MQETNEALLSEILINTTDELALRELFEGRTNNHRYWTSNRSTKTGALDDMIRRLTCRHAFDYMPYAIKLTLEQSEEALFVTALALTRNLVQRSSIIGVNKSFQDHKGALSIMVSNMHSAAAELLWLDIEDCYDLITTDWL